MRLATITTGPDSRIISGSDSTPNRRKNRVSAAFAPSPWLAWAKGKRTTSHTAMRSSPGRPPRNAKTRAWGKASATATSFAVGGGASAGRAAPTSTTLRCYRPRAGRTVRDSDGRLDDVTVGLVVLHDTAAGD